MNLPTFPYNFVTRNPTRWQSTSRWTMANHGNHSSTTPETVGRCGIGTIGSPSIVPMNKKPCVLTLTSPKMQRDQGMFLEQILNNLCYFFSLGEVNNLLCYKLVFCDHLELVLGKMGNQE